MNRKNNAVRFQKKSLGQATTEYVVLIAIIVSIIFGVGIAFRASLEQLFKSRVGDQMLGRLFDTQRMHRFYIKKI